MVGDGSETRVISGELEQKKLTDLVLGELGLLSSANKGYVVGSTKHFCNCNSGIEILDSLSSAKGLDCRVEASGCR